MSRTIGGSGSGELYPASSPAPETKYQRFKDRYHVLTDRVEPGLELDRLFALLEHCPNATLREAAADQLGQLARKAPTEVDATLTRVGYPDCSCMFMTPPPNVRPANTNPRSRFLTVARSPTKSKL
ncbi:unnamed protein product, partial [Dibothriocephalus latus]